MAMEPSCAKAKVSTDPDAIATWLREKGYSASKLGLEAGALSTWLFHELTTQGWDVVCLETRQVHQVLKVHRDKTDRGDAVGIAQLLRSGWYRSVHTKSFEAHASRALLKARVELVRIRQDLENTIRGLLKPFWHPAPPRRSTHLRRSCAHELCSAAGAGGRHGGASAGARAGHGRDR
jgi:transposase